MNKQKQYTEAFISGEIGGLKESPEKPEHLQTSISHLFFFKDTVYKFCRNDNEGYNAYFYNLADDALRKGFCVKDFRCNKHFSPSIYRELFGVRAEGGQVVLAHTEDADELVFLMKRLSPASSIKNLIEIGGLSSADMKTLSIQMMTLIDSYQEIDAVLEDRTNNIVLREFIVDIKNLVTMTGDAFSELDLESHYVFLESYVAENESVLEKEGRDVLISSVDNHIDNAFWDNGRVCFIDLFLPKREWGIVEPLYSVARIYTDLLVLFGGEYSKSLLDGYVDHYKLSGVNMGRLKFYVTFNTILRAAYLSINAHDDEGRAYAKKYLDYLKNIEY